MTDKIENSQTSSDEKSKISTRKSIWKPVFYTISAVIILPLFLLILILTTSYGQKTTIKIIDNLMDNLTITNISGELQKGLLLEGIRFQSKGVDTFIPKINVQLTLSCLLKAKFCLQNFSLESPQININTSLLPSSEDQNKKSTVFHKIVLPISIETNNIEINNLHLVIDDKNINLDKFKTSFTLNNDTGLTLSPTIINKLTINTQIIKSRHSTKSPTAKMPIDWERLEQELTPALLDNIEEINLPFDVHVENIQGIDWEYQLIDQTNPQYILMNNIQLQADATNDTIKLKKLDIESSLGNLNGQGQLLLKNQFPIDIQISTDIHKLTKNKQILFPNTQAVLRVLGELKKQTNIELTTKGIANIHLRGIANFNQPKTPFLLTLVSDKLQYPIDKKAINPLNIKNFNMVIKGDILNYHLTLDSNIKGMGVPNSEINVAINGTLSSINIDKFFLKTLQGYAQLRGQLSWKDNILWQSNLDLNQLNFSSYLSNYPAILSGKLTSNGQLNNDQWKVDIPNINITGTISKQPITLKGNLSLSPETLLDIPELFLHYGKNKIIAKGYLNKQSNLNLVIDAPDLSGLIPNFNATAFGNIALSGKVTEPNLNINLKGRNIRYKDIRLSKINVNTNLHSEQFIQVNVNLDIKDFNYNNIKLKSLELSAKGNEKEHNIQLKSQGEPIALNLNLSGNFDRTSQIWKANLSKINIDSPIGKWRTNKDINLNYYNKTISTTINAHCWENTDIDLCFPNKFNVGKKGEILFDINRINLNLVNQLLKKEILAGILTSQGNISWGDKKSLGLKLELKGKNILTKYPIDYRTFKLSIPNLQLKANLNNNNLNIDTSINIENKGKIISNILLTDLINQKNLSGSLKITDVNLDLVNQLLKSNEKVNGNVITDLKFAGTLNKPLLYGQFSVRNINTKVKTLPFDIDNGKLNLAFQGNQSTLDGNLQTTDSVLTLNGKANWNSLENWQTALQIKGDKFNVKIPSIAKLKITPNIKITANPSVLELTGFIDIPWAKIEIESLPDTAVPISEDEIILDGPNKSKDIQIGRAPIAAKTKSGIEIRSDLKINIGNEVNLNAYGLNTKLKGLLSIQQDQGHLGLYGQIYLKDGRYTSFGQDLLIQKGIISFSGEPNQPMLNIRAIRNPSTMTNQNVTAGVNIIGAVAAPEVNIFAEPSTSQAEALSYLLTGHSLENNGEVGSGSSIGAALISLSLSKNGKLLGGIGESFGIQDLNLGTSGAGGTSKVEVSGYITPRLQVKYGIGLFDGLAEFTLRYRLLPQLYLQSISGVNQAVDLLYELEF